MHGVAWRGMWTCVRSKDAQKQLARTSLKQLILIWFGAQALKIFRHPKGGGGGRLWKIVGLGGGHKGGGGDGS